MQKEKLKKYIFIIDEINRGEISKIFGELFFSIDPGYRGSAGAVATQYENLHENRSDKFYVPENIYIIGTMNDIDRSVDSFDFAMRRRFRFIEIKADTRVEMLDLLEKNVKLTAMEKMAALNKAIAETEGLNENYQIGASYFLKLQHIGFVLKFMGAIPSIMSLSKSYAGIFIIGGILGTINVTLGNLAVAQGAAKISLKAMIVGSISNMILDPIFIFVLNLGVTIITIPFAIGTYKKLRF